MDEREARSSRPRSRGGARILIVGVGALGQVLGAHLAAGGASVHALVKPGREEAVKRGVRLWRLRRGRRPLALEFNPAGVITSPEQAETSDWDAVLLCISSDALQGEWARQLAAATAPATVASVGQAARDAERLAALVPAERAAHIVPAVLAWHGPLAGEVPSPGTAYWIPPRASLATGGETERAARLVGALRAGGLRAHFSSGAALEGARMAAKTMPIVAALEVKGWSLSALRADPLLDVAAKAAAEAEAAVVARIDGSNAGIRPPATRAARLSLRVLPVLAPFDLEAYASQQFSKVARQSRLMLEEWIELAEEQGLDAESLKQLASLVTSRPFGSSLP